MELKKIITIFFIFLFFLSYPCQIRAATLSSTDIGPIEKNNIFDLPIILNTEEKKINVVEIIINFDPKFLEVQNISEKDSIFSFFPIKEINNEKGFVKVIGGIIFPGYYGIGQAFSVELQSKRPGITKIYFDENCKILTVNENKNVFRSANNIEINISQNNEQKNKTLSSTSNIYERQIYSYPLLSEKTTLLLLITNISTLILSLIINIVIVVKKKKN